MTSAELFQVEKERSNPFTAYNHITVTSVEEDHAVYSLTLRPESLNPYGMIHGGIFSTMADNATAAAAHTDGRKYVTIQSVMNFLANQSAGTITAEANVRHRDEKRALVEVAIYGDNRKMLASGSYTLYCIEQTAN